MEKYKEWIIEELRSWLETYDEDIWLKETLDRYSDGKDITAIEYEDMLFHLWQKFGDIGE